MDVIHQFLQHTPPIREEFFGNWISSIKYLFSINHRELGYEIARIFVEVVPRMNVATLLELLEKVATFVASRSEVTDSELLIDEFGAAIK
jgi:hypothetical protein